jgi:hypothetical protein
MTGSLSHAQPSTNRGRRPRELRLDEHESSPWRPADPQVRRPLPVASDASLRSDIPLTSFRPVCASSTPPGATRAVSAASNGPSNIFRRTRHRISALDRPSEAASSQVRACAPPGIRTQNLRIKRALTTVGRLRCSPADLALSDPSSCLFRLLRTSRPEFVG